MKEYAIIGGGMGGCATAALLHAQGKEVMLFEKESYLGGCASTFHHKGYLYNSGATTLCGYDEGRVVKKLFDVVGVKPDIVPSDPSIVVIQGDKIIPRYKDVEAFIEIINQAYPHPKHALFWKLIWEITQTFYGEDGYYYSNASWGKKLRSLASYIPLASHFWGYLWQDARGFIRSFYGEIDEGFFDFIDAQILIVAQTTSASTNMLTAALALGYTFEENYYCVGGMGRVCEALVSHIPDVYRKEPILSIASSPQGFHLTSKKGTYEARRLIMGTSYFESGKLMQEGLLKGYYDRYAHLNNHQSAFVLYMSIPQGKRFEHHYQLIAKENLPFTLSKSLFVSISIPEDTLLSINNTLSITASIHTDERLWLSLDDEHYRAQKEALSLLLETWICDTLGIAKESIIQRFAATPKTFGRYIHRTQLGGIPMHRSNLLPFLPSNDTPISGLYSVGDTSYAAQGWPGVVMGAFNLLKVLHG